MSEKKIIAVVGATGAQGGGLVRAILNDPSSGFAVRALTRKVDSDKGKELKKLGAEVVAADLDDVESLKRAFAGALWRVFAHQLLGAFLSGEGIRPGEEHGPSGKACRRPTRHLVHARGHQAVGAA